MKPDPEIEKHNEATTEELDPIKNAHRHSHPYFQAKTKKQVTRKDQTIGKIAYFCSLNNKV